MTQCAMNKRECPNRSFYFTFLVAALSVALLTGCESEPRSNVTNSSIGATELLRQIDSGTQPIILDVRTQKEFSAGHLPGALHLPHNELSNRLTEMPTDKTREIVVHCQTGKRAEIAKGNFATEWL